MGCNCNKGFSNYFMLLKPEEVSVVDLICVLFLHDLEKRKFVDCPEGTSEESFKRRWLIFVSILVQKCLSSVGRPMAWFGSKVEHLLNLVSSNQNVGLLFWNFLQGKVVIPYESSATFLSLVGNLDKRVKLDESIKNGDGRYFAALSVMAAKASYENEAYIKNVVTEHWEMDFLGFFDFWNHYQGKATTQAFMLQDKKVDPNIIVVAFRGTEPFDVDDWCSDFDISWYGLPSMGKVHGGFMKALGLQENQGWPKELKQTGSPPKEAYYAIRDTLRCLLQANERAKFIVTGHSLGGALAVLFPAVLSLHEEIWMLERLEGVYTFGQPRVGDDMFCKFMDKQFKGHDIRYHRFVYCNDMVPRLPYDDSTLMFKHFGTCVYYDSFYKGKIVTEEPNKNYFSPVSIIPKTLNAIWELIRSFVIPYTEGPDYKECFALRMLRLMGLVMAGIPAHSLQDYVNATRLGAADIHLQVDNTRHD